MALVAFEIEKGVIAAPRVGVGGAEAHPRRIAQAEALLAGQPPGVAAFAAAAEAAAAAVDPLTDAQTDAVYRRELVATVVRRALEQAASRS
jgi:aerobic carbon-monoxide dehydrogenase medium subunit